MTKVIFDYNCEKTIIECDNDETMEEIIQRFRTERELEHDKLFFVKDAKEVSKSLKVDQIANSFDKENKSINILVFEKNLEEESVNNSYSFYREENSEKLNNFFDKVIPKMQSDINELGKDIGLAKLLKQNIQTIELELKELNDKVNQNQDLNEQIKMNKSINESLLNEIKNNTSKNNSLLQEIKSNIDLNNQIKDEININKNLKNGLKKYIDEQLQRQNQTLRNTTVSNSEKLQNCQIGNSPNSIVKVQNDGKIYSNIIFTKGMIIAWFGSSNNIPKDWAICDGTKGTPDLRNRFIIGQSQEIPFNTIGGNSSIKLSKSNLPQLGTGYFSADSHRGSYHHSSTGFIKYLSGYATYIRQTDNGDNWGSNYEIDLNSGMNSSPIDIMNPYFALFYIMKL